MKVVAFLGDHASAGNDGLVTVVRAGVNSLNRSAFPCPLDVDVVVVLDHEGSEGLLKTDISVRISTIEEGASETTTVLELRGAGDVEVRDGRLPVALVAVPTRQAVLPSPGFYEVLVNVDGIESSSASFIANLEISGQ